MSVGPDGQSKFEGSADSLGIGPTSLEQDGCRWDSSLTVEEVERQLIEVWEATLEKSPILRLDEFHGFGAPSRAIELIHCVEQHFGRRLPLSTFFTGGSTVAGMARALIAAGDSTQPSAEPTLVALQPRGSHLPICWLPGGSGMSAMEFVTISRLLGPDQPVYALETPIRREGPFDLRTRAATYVRRLRAKLPQPYLLFGYSYGAWMALEMARQLRAAGAEVRRLVVFDMPVPRKLSGRERAIKTGQHLRWHLRQALVAPLEEACRVGRGLLLRLGGAPVTAPAAGPLPPGSIYDVLDRAIRASIISYSWEAHPPWAGRITLVLTERVAWPGMDGPLDLRLGWREIAGGGLEVIRVPGDHLSMLEGAEAKDLAVQLRRLLEEDSCRALSR